MSDLNPKNYKPPVPQPQSDETKLYALVDAETGDIRDLATVTKSDSDKKPELSFYGTTPVDIPVETTGDESSGYENLSWLEEAAKVVRTSRRSTYGHPLLNFARIAALYNTYFEGRLVEGQFITPVDIVYLNIMTKIAREKQIHKDDNVVDIIGYAATHNAIDNRMRELGYKEGSAAFDSMTREEFNALLIKLEKLEI